MSEQYIVDCFNNSQNGCKGGNPYNVFVWLSKGRQIVLNESYPAYNASNNTCQFDGTMDVATPKPRGVKSPYKLYNNETALAEVVRAYGPVSVAISVNLIFAAYKSGIYNDSSCTGDVLNHAVLCVGYGTDQLLGMDYW